MKFIWVTDAQSNDKVSINCDHVIAVFNGPKETPAEGHTVIALSNGQILVKETDIDIVGMLVSQ